MASRMDTNVDLIIVISCCIELEVWKTVVQGITY